MKIRLPSGKNEELDIGPLTVEELLLHLQISQGEVFVSRSGQIIPEDTLLDMDDEVRIIQVVFGGRLRWLSHRHFNHADPF